jgi:transcriptional regulator with XRE-family HTH domain
MNMPLNLKKQKKEKEEKTRIEHFAYLERKRIREEKIERAKKEKEEQKMKFIQKMNDAYGIRWFLFMKPEEDIDENEFNLLNKDEILEFTEEYFMQYEAQQIIREEEAEAEYDRLERESDDMFTRIEENRTANVEKMKSSMSPEEFGRWYKQYMFDCDMEDMDMVDDYCNDCFYEQSYALSRYATHAPPRYVEYAYQTGILKDYKDKPLERADREKNVSEI